MDQAAPDLSGRPDLQGSSIRNQDSHCFQLKLRATEVDHMPSSTSAHLELSSEILHYNLSFSTSFGTALAIGIHHLVPRIRSLSRSFDIQFSTVETDPKRAGAGPPAGRSGGYRLHRQKNRQGDFTTSLRT